MLITRIIKTRECSICDLWLPRLDKQDFQYEIYDADAPENQKELDDWGIDDLPVIQIVQRTDESDVVKFQFPPGTYSVRAINHKTTQIESQSNS